MLLTGKLIASVKASLFITLNSRLFFVKHNCITVKYIAFKVLTIAIKALKKLLLNTAENCLSIFHAAQYHLSTFVQFNQNINILLNHYNFTDLPYYELFS